MTIGQRSAVLQRRLKIADWIRRHGEMRVDELSASLGVSEVTIRGDLSYLEDQGLIIRSFGKARPAKTATPHEAAPNTLPRRQIQPMLRAAAALAAPGQTVLIGAGRLPLQAVPLFADFGDMTLLLTSVDAIPIARACLDARLFVPGGEIAGEDGALGGTQALRGLEAHAIGLAVLEAEALGADGALLIRSKPAERLAQAACRRAQRSAVLVAGGALSLERRPSQLPLDVATDIILPAAPSQRGQELLEAAGFRAVGGEAAHFARARRAAARDPSFATAV